MELKLMMVQGFDHFALLSGAAKALSLRISGPLHLG